ncbi:MAG: hypothetical protein H6747_02610 [Deltaproteobacteria bacterium]|nr:hypothetical protein [Deltaproteobacteria bacterium]
MKLLLPVAAALAVLLPLASAVAATPTASLASTDVPDAQKRPRRVALLPVKSALGRVSDLFAPERAPEHLALVAGVESSLGDALRTQPYVELVDPAGVRARLGDDHSSRATARLAAERYRLGLEYYLGLAPARAVESLRRSVALYQEIHQDVVGPKSIADAAFMLGVALVDAGNAVAAHVALKDAFALQPERRFRPRFFAPQVEAALSAALADHLSTGNHDRPYGGHERLAALARRLDVDAIVSATVVRDEGGALEVRLVAWRKQRQGFEAEARLPVAGLERSLEPFTSRWLACVPVAEANGAVGPRRRQNSVWMDTSASYALYLRQPTRLSFHSLGFAAGVAVDIRPNLEWFVRMNMYTSLSDPYRDLLHAFNSVRAVAGIGFSLERGRLRLVLQPGLDLHVLGSFIATTDPDCKLYGESHPLCSSATVSNLEADVLVGLNIATVALFDLGRRFLLIGRASTSTYFLPLDGTDRLNFPVSVELGLGYRF